MSLDKYLDYWNQFYENGKYDLKEILPFEMINYFDADFYPEPYYGYLSENTQKDILLLLINPGDIQLEKLLKANSNLRYDEICLQFNEFVKNRYLTWKEDDYIKYETLNKNTAGGKWRASRLKQMERLINHKVNFIHTLEFFPFHSKQWNVKKSLKDRWLYELEATSLAMRAISDIAQQRKFRHVVGIGLDWTILFAKYPEIFELKQEEILLGKTEKPAHRVYQYKIKGTPESLPIVIYSGSSMNLPVSTDSALKLLRKALEVK